MTETKVFHSITSTIFACSKRYVEDHNKAKYNPPDANQGKVAISIEGHFPSPATTFELGFDFNPSTGDLTYTLISKQGYLPVSIAWDALGRGIDFCGDKSMQEPKS